MGKTTDIEWCDSVLNLQMGCDGCELWNPKAGVRHCYAGVLTERYAAGRNKGFPVAFDQPELFLHRLDEAVLWPDLTGKDRKEKPWLDGRPRMIFLDDMGDTFTESLPLDWLAQPYGPMVCPKGHKPPRVQRVQWEGEDFCSCTAAGCCVQWKPASPLEIMARTPHVYMLLTKRARRMREFSEKHPLPANVWPGVSVTTQQTAVRVGELLGVQGGGVRWVSAEPLLERVGLHRWLADRKDMTPRQGVGLVITGGESGPKARPCDMAWVRSIVEQCRAAHVPCFVKQLGKESCWHDEERKLVCNKLIDVHALAFDGWKIVPKLKDPKGGDMEEWPEDLRVRQFPPTAP